MPRNWPVLTCAWYRFPQMSPGSVLVIDDDEWVGRLLAVALREAGYEVFHSASAVSGYEAAVEKQPDCIICDVDLPDVDAPIGSLSGGQRQCVAIARAIFFGARVLILDEPTAALGVKQSGMVLRYITAAKEQGFGVIFITHNPHHAHMVGDHFVLLNRGRQKLDCTYDEITLEHLTQEMAGGNDLEALAHELGRK